MSLACKCLLCLPTPLIGRLQILNRYLHSRAFYVEGRLTVYTPSPLFILTNINTRKWSWEFNCWRSHMETSSSVITIFEGNHGQKNACREIEASLVVQCQDVVYLILWDVDFMFCFSLKMTTSCPNKCVFIIMIINMFLPSPIWWTKVLVLPRIHFTNRNQK